MIKKLVLGFMVCGCVSGNAMQCSEVGLSEERDKVFALCCKAVAVGDKENRDKFIDKLYKFNMTCEEIWPSISSYCDEEKHITYPQFKLHQAEILVYMSILHHAIKSGLLQSPQRRRGFLHWYNKQNKQLQQWL